MMNSDIKKYRIILFAVLMTFLSMAGLSSAAVQTYYLDVKTFTKTMPGGAVITMWGYASCTDGTYGTCGQPSAPGPILTATAGDTVTINIRNSITGLYTEPTSLVINGQVPSAAPVPAWTDSTTGARTSTTQRVRSFNTEAATGGGTASYTWNSVKAGTYLYQSGTHPAVQVQMGLYGMLKVDAAANQAYAGQTYASEAILFFSEIEPALHAAVADGTYGTSLTSTINYEPKYFLINGEAFTSAVSPLFAGNANTDILLRFLNAGLETHVPSILSSYMTLIAEDGNLYPYAKEQYGFVLPAGKTVDALITSTTNRYIPLYDRRLDLTNAASGPGGMLTYLGVADTPTYALNILKLGSGSGRVMSVPSGIDCGIKCTENFHANTPVTVKAIPSVSSFFVEWTGACTGTGDCVVPMSGLTKVNARFGPVSAVTVVSPNGGEVIPSGSIFTIGWNAPSTAAKFKLEYSLNGTGGPWVTIASNVTGSTYSWKVPKLANNATARIRITAYDNTSVQIGAPDISNAGFRIEVVKVTSPNGGETLTPGSQATITWDTNATIRSVNKVIIQYSTNNGATWSPVTTISGYNPGSFVWTVPIVASANCRLRVLLRDSSNLSVGTDLSDAAFTIN